MQRNQFLFQLSLRLRGGDVAKTCGVEVAKSEPIECRRLPACVFWGPCAVQVSMLHVNMMLFSYSTSCTARLKASLYTLTPSRKFSLSRQSVTCCLCQIQGDKEKLLYELDSVQAELEKCRMISERWRQHSFSLHNIFNSLNTYLDSKNILLLINTFLSRLQKEKEDALADIDCKREQYDKLQVSELFCLFLLRSEETFFFFFFTTWGNFSILFL